LQALLQRRGLVRTSGTPGRTRLINFFRVVIAPDGGRAPQDRRALLFVDLPGFGYAKVSKEEREKWLPFVDQYLTERASLKVLVLLVDPRREAGARERESLYFDETEIAKYVAERGVLVLAVMTKADKLKKHERKPALQKVERALGMPAIAVSATDGDGVEELWRRIAKATANTIG
jgi:GTP-binding protein